MDVCRGRVRMLRDVREGERDKVEKGAKGGFELSVRVRACTCATAMRMCKSSSCSDLCKREVVIDRGAHQTQESSNCYQPNFEEISWVIGIVYYSW